MALTGWGFYKIYLPLKLHFESGYDLFKYNSKIKNLTGESLFKRSDQDIFNLWGSRFNDEKKAGQFCLANLVYNSSGFIYNEYAEGDEVYTKWKAIQEALEYQLKKDLSVISETIQTGRVSDFNTMFHKTKKGNSAPIIQLMMASLVTKEFLSMMDNVVPVIVKLKRQHESDPLVVSELDKLIRYKPFLSSKTEASRVIFRRFVAENGT